MRIHPTRIPPSCDVITRPRSLPPRHRSYGANVDAFLGAVTDTAGAAQGGAGRSGLGVLDSALEAVSAVKVVESLNAIRELLRAQAADVAQASAGGAGGAGAKVDDARATFLNLAALLSVANGAATKKVQSVTQRAQRVRVCARVCGGNGIAVRSFLMQCLECVCALLPLPPAQFDASEWSLTEAEAVRIARVFARHAPPLCLHPLSRPPFLFACTRFTHHPPPLSRRAATTAGAAAWTRRSCAASWTSWGSL
jgi:hypothetical protein